MCSKIASLASDKEILEFVASKIPNQATGHIEQDQIAYERFFETSSILHHYRAPAGPLMTEVVVNSAKPEYVVIVFHGLHASPQDFLSFAQLLVTIATQHKERVACILPYGILECEMLSTRHHWDRGQFRWWDLVEIPDVKQLLRQRKLASLGEGLKKLVGNLGTPSGLPTARKKVLECIDAVCHRLQVSDGNVTICGFSQGSMLTQDLLFAMRSPPLAAGIWSGISVNRKEHRAVFDSMHPHEQIYRRTTLVQVSHGTRDLVIPVLAGQALRDDLHYLGFDVRYREFSGQHEVPEEVTAEFIELFLAACRRGPAVPPKHLARTCAVVPQLPASDDR